MVGHIVLIVKDDKNKFEVEVIAPLMKDIRHIRCIANSTYTVVGGTKSVDRIYDTFVDFCYGLV